MTGRRINVGIIGGGLMGREIAAPLRRWPAQLERSMGMVHAGLQVAGISLERDVEEDAESASFRMRLEAGPTELLTTLRRKDGVEHGAYFTSVRWLGE